ncbi:MAG: hypothetical protein WCL50_18440 [Spirochaetota bacterium]
MTEASPFDAVSPPLRAALEAVYNTGTWTEVLVLTDGDVGDVVAISELAESRFSSTCTRLSLLGIGSSPSGDALAAIARSGGGAMGTVHPGDRIEMRALALVRGMLAGRAEKLRLLAGESSCELAAPVDAALGERCRFLARFPKGQTLPLLLSLSFERGGREERLGLVMTEAGPVAGGTGALAALWSRDRVSDILDRAARAKDGPSRRRLEKAAVGLAREAGILSIVTSLVVVDPEGERVEGVAARIEVPVLLPAGYGGARSAVGEGIIREDLALSCCASAAPSSKRDRASRSMLFSSGLDLASPRAPARRRTKAKADFWDLLALQLPGGGFGPREELLALLALAPKVARALDGPPSADLPADEEERCILAALALAWLEREHSGQAGEWEPLVAQSRQLVESCAAHALADAGERAAPMAFARRLLPNLEPGRNRASR